MPLIHFASQSNNEHILSREAIGADYDLVKTAVINTNRWRTLVAPPSLSGNQVAVLTARDAWSIQPDYRGYVGYDEGDVKHEVNVINVTPDPVWTTTAPTPPPPEPVIPTIVTRRQAKRALFDNGHLSLVIAALEALPEPAQTKAMIDWSDAGTFQRSNAIVQQMAAVLSMDESELDALFIQASLIS
ncbi:MAG: hypothetical protein COB23_03230 [Methylophaga sp.]|nr:MAG: hypothetical protein COB23_03230 [Methylophaga sp.]